MGTKIATAAKITSGAGSDSTRLAAECARTTREAAVA